MKRITLTRIVCWMFKRMWQTLETIMRFMERIMEKSSFGKSSSTVDKWW